MVRTQIQLTEEQSSRLKRVAAERGVSMATVIREALEATLPAGEVDERHRRALSVAGRFQSGRRDIAADHDAALAQIYGE